MTIAPLNFAPQQAYSAFDWTPLARLGDVAQKYNQDQQLANLQQRYGTPDATASNTTVPSTGTNYQRAIAGIESGGKYDLLGPVTSGGDRAYGKYQVMGANIPEWTTRTFGSPMTKEQFLASPAAQDAVFNKIFGGYVDKYGPTGAAKAWFAGEGGMNNPNARDILGTTVEGYARRFNQGLGVE